MIVEVNGTRLHVERRGAGDDALLFMHGFTLDHRMWAPQLAALPPDRSAVAYDLRGMGRSALPDPAVPYRHVDDAAALCDELGLARVHVVGHSISGLYALELALLRPALVARITLVGMSGLGTIPFPPDVQALFGAVRAAAAAGDLASAKRQWAAGGWFTPARERPAVAAALDDMLRDYSGWHWRSDNPARNLEPPVAARLAEVAAPTTVVVGERDLPYNLAVAEALAQGIPDARLVRIAGAGHMIGMETPAALDAVLAS